MYNEQEQKQRLTSASYNDQIDLRDVFEKIGAGFKSIYLSILSLISCIKRNFVLICIFVLSGLALGYVAFYYVKPYYTSSMTLVLAEIRNQFVENQLRRLSIMIKEDNYEAIAKDLDINPEAAKQIKEMNFFNLDQDRIAEDSVLTGSPFEIELSMYDNSFFPTMEVALTNYLENNRYFSKQKLIKQREVESMINRLKGEIAALDSVKMASASPRGPVNGFVYGQPIDPANLFRESVAMYEKQVELEADLEQLDNIQIVNSFAPRLRPTGPNLMKFLVIGGGIAFVIGAFVAVSLEKRKRK